MMRVKYLQDRLALRPFKIHVKLIIAKNVFTIRDARVKYCKLALRYLSKQVKRRKGFLFDFLRCAYR